MTKQRFETALQQLKPRRREVLELFLAGNTDEAIAQSLNISKATVRLHIRNICQDFGLKNGCDDDRTSQRANLMALFAQYKPDLLHKPTVTENQNQASNSISTSNTSTSSQQNTFTNEYDPNFVGRDDAIIALDNLINKGVKIIQIIAPGGTGKTRLAQKYLERRFKTVLEFPIAKEIKDIASIENLLAFNLRKLGEEPGKELMESLQRFKQKVQNQEIGILIDNLEPALDASGKFIDQHRSYVELLRVLTDPTLKSIIILITSREPLCEGLDITMYKLPSLNVEAWREYWHYQEINPDTSILTKIHNAYGGNALAMRVLCNPILNEFNGDAFAYWRENKTEENLEVETAVANLIKEQFERLAHINLDAYNLLCRMGCYRYQDEYVSTVPEQGIFSLLWDVDKNQHKTIIKVLKERALVEFNNDEYSLHPVIRKEAIERLRNSEYWETANTKAAEFWMESVKKVENIKDAVTAFEAYYHYLEINNFDAASRVILFKRTNRWVEESKLGKSLYRLGLFRQIYQSIELVLDHITSDQLKSSLYDILGSTYAILGNINKSVVCHTKSRELAVKAIENYSTNELQEFSLEYLEELAIGSMIDLGLCKIALFEYDEALSIFESLNLDNSNRTNLQLPCFFCLAFLNSYLGYKEKASFFINRCEESQFELTEWSAGYKSYFIGLAYRHLGDFNKAIATFDEGFVYAHESQDKRLKARLLTVMADIYREQESFNSAISNHQESIHTLHDIDAKCDLAEAYFQLALTYQKIGNKASSEEYFNQSLYLWSPEQIDAPKQIERVLNAMND